MYKKPKLIFVLLLPCHHIASTLWFSVAVQAPAIKSAFQAEKTGEKGISLPLLKLIFHLAVIEYFDLYFFGWDLHFIFHMVDINYTWGWEISGWQYFSLF